MLIFNSLKRNQGFLIWGAKVQKVSELFTIFAT